MADIKISDLTTIQFTEAYNIAESLTDQENQSQLKDSLFYVNNIMSPDSIVQTKTKLASSGLIKETIQDDFALITSKLKRVKAKNFFYTYDDYACYIGLTKKEVFANIEAAQSFISEVASLIKADKNIYMDYIALQKLFGVAKTDRTLSTDLAFPTSRVIEDFYATDLTVDAIANIRKKAIGSIPYNSPAKLFVSPTQYSKLLEDPDYINGFNNKRFDLSQSIIPIVHATEIIPITPKYSSTLEMDLEAGVAEGDSLGIHFKMPETTKETVLCTECILTNASKNSLPVEIGEFDIPSDEKFKNFKADLAQAEVITSAARLGGSRVSSNKVFKVLIKGESPDAIKMEW